MPQACINGDAQLGGVQQCLRCVHAEHMTATAADLVRASHSAPAQQLRSVVHAGVAMFTAPDATLPQAATAVLNEARSLRRACEDRRRGQGWDSGAWQECLIFSLMCVVHSTAYACFLRLTHDVECTVMYVQLASGVV